ncbi:substrate-binding domain-containing protein [Paraburkholderia nemoris]|uniref:Ribose import binding protein RbsB n=1 Tax=Paraburkholderia nemoris TaxID=2793076 RepID=A0ABM8T3M1_9BURK|nr:MULTISPECIES: substrate-binding domain-containing protein [Paraburkholderia]MBK3816141.1 sugar ABC transporter substrate-binding protein [Paraburkholderia aspalathi]CAE6824786.1 Ribose import binding protein RbsB [Paraburkholderia nemoris]CAE6855437.1 Ribose import binding protein RbsB [Paraburkholderia nemoris]
MPNNRVVGIGLVSFVLALGLSSCNRDSGEHASGGTKTLGVVLPNLTNPYYVAMKKSFEESGAAKGMHVEVSIADNDDARELSEVQSFIQKKVDAVAVNCVSSGPCVSVISELNRANIPAFAINILPDTDGMKQQGAHIVQGVQTDQKAGGVFIGRQLLKDLGDKANAVIGIVGEPTSIAANARDEGFKQAIASNPNLKVVALVNGKVEETTSLKVTTEMLQGNPTMTVVYSDTEPSALGAIAAINQLGMKDKVKLYAFVDKEGVKQIQSGDILRAGAIQEPVRLAALLVDSVSQQFAGKVPAAMVNSPPLLVDKANAEQVVSQAY